MGGSHLPPPASKAGREWRQWTGDRPAAERIGCRRNPAITLEDGHGCRQEPRAKAVEPVLGQRKGGQPGRRTNGDGHGWLGNFISLCHPAPQMAEDGWDGNFDRADIRTGATKRGGVGKLTCSFGSQHLRRKDRANGPGDKPAIRKTAHVLIHRTNIGTGAAANAFENLPSDRILQNFGTAVIQKYEMKFLWDRTRPARGGAP